MPSVIYSLVTFKPTSPEVFADAQHIFAHVRIPHHAEVARWFDWVACVQILWIVFAIFLVRGSRLMLLMVVPFLGAVGLTLVQLATANDTLALMFPWRTSVILVPIATAVVLIKFGGICATLVGQSSANRQWFQHRGGRRVRAGRAGDFILWAWLSEQPG